MCKSGAKLPIDDNELAGIPESVSTLALSTRLKELTDSGKITREGERRGTRYSVAPSHGRDR